MNESVRVLLLLLLGVSAFAQGTISLNNRTASGDRPVLIHFGFHEFGPGALPVRAQAQLFLISRDGSVPLYPATTFRKSPLNETFFVEPVEVVVPGHPAGSTVRVFLRAWAEDEGIATWWGESIELTLVLGGTTQSGETLTPATLDDMTSFGMWSLSSPVSLFSSIALDGSDLKLTIFAWDDFGFNFVLETSTDFQTWQPILTNPPIHTNFSLPIETSTNGTRFFRTSAHWVGETGN